MQQSKNVLKYCELHYNMQHQTEVAVKRAAFRSDIRRKQVEDYFTKRRYEITNSQQIAHKNPNTSKDASNQHSKQDIDLDQSGKTQTRQQRQQLQKVNGQGLSIEEPLSQLQRLIQKFPISSMYPPFQMIYQIDPSSRIFRQLTYWDARGPHWLADLILIDKDRLQEFNEYRRFDNWRNRIFDEQQTEKIKEVWLWFEHWQENSSEDLRQIIKTTYRTDAIQSISQKTVDFLCMTVNFLLLGSTVEQIGRTHLAKKNNFLDKYDSGSVLKQKPSFMQWEQFVCIKFIHNFLAGQDEKLLPFLGNFVISVGNHPKLLPLYHNIFLIKGQSEQLRLKIFDSYVAALGKDQEQLLNSHKQLIYILFLGLQSGSMPFRDSAFAFIAQYLLELIDGLLKVLNIRYEPSNQLDQQDDFVKYVIASLQKIAQNSDALRFLLQKCHICRFLLNQLVFPNNFAQARVTSYALCLLSKAALDEYAAYHLLESEPLLVTRIFLLLTRFASKPPETQLIVDLVTVITNLCIFSKVAELLIDDNKVGLVASLYHSHKSGKKGKMECGYLLINIFNFLRKNTADHGNCCRLLLNVIRSPDIVSMLLDMLKYTSDKRELVVKTLGVVAFLQTFRSNNSPSYRMIDEQLVDDSKVLYILMDQFLNDTTLLQRIETIEDLQQDECLAQKASSIKYLLRQGRKLRDLDGEEEWL